jgi:hypothetical protein
MPAYYADSVQNFLGESTSSIVGKLSAANANVHFLQYSDATLVWQDTIEHLRPISSGLVYRGHSCPRSAVRRD